MSTTDAAPTVTIASGRIALAAITPSKTNPRKTFDKASLDELTESVRKLDVLQPILVRPNGGPDHYELVAGERRYRAAKAAGLKDIPATVRELSDGEVLEIQVIENLQRKDLRPLEEAEGFDRLLRCAHPDGRKYTADEIATKVGKSRGYVYAKMKLLALCPEARKALEEDKIGETTAVLVARIPVHDLQRTALKEITKGKWAGAGPMTHRDAADHLQRNYMLRLNEAPFDVAKIYVVEGTPIAPACGECPKRTGNQPELFADVKSADVCTDPQCFQKKRDAVLTEKRAAAIAAGQTVIAGKAAKEIKPYAHNSSLAGGYVQLDAKCWDDPKQRTYAALVGKQVTPALLEDPHDPNGALIEVVRLADIKPILKEKGAVRPASRNSGSREATEKANRKADLEEKVYARLFAEVCAKLPATLGKEELAAIANELMYGDPDYDAVAAALLPAPDEKKKAAYQPYRALQDAISKFDAAKLARVVVALVLSRDLQPGGKPECLLAAAKRFKVDVDKVRQAVSVEEKRKEAVKAESKKKAAPAPTKKTKKKK